MSLGAAHSKQPKINCVHTGRAFYLIFHPAIGGLVLKVENENDFHPQSPVNCAGANMQPRIKSRGVLLKWARVQN